MQAYTVEQVAHMLHVGRDKIYYLLRTNQLQSIKIGKLRRITDQQIAEFITSVKVARGPEGGIRTLRNSLPSAARDTAAAHAYPPTLDC